MTSSAPSRPFSVFVIRGGLAGWDGWLSSAGMDALAKRLHDETDNSCKVSTWNWSNSSALKRVVDLLPSSTGVILIGYSGGGWQAEEIAIASHRKVDFIIGMDPSPWWQVNKLWLPGCVHGICYWNQAPNFGSFGGAKYSGPNIEVRKISMNHLSVQFDSALRDRVVSDIKVVLTTSQPLTEGAV